MVLKMKQQIISIIFICVLFGTFLFMLNPVSAETYHVYPGDDIVTVIGNALEGDTVYVHAGDYILPSAIVINDNGISIIGDSPHTTIIDANGQNDGIFSNYGDITIKNLTVKNTGVIDFIDGDGIDIDGNYTTIENCIAHDNHREAFEVNRYCTLKNCLSYNNGYGFLDFGYCTYINCTAANNLSEGFYDTSGNTKVINCIAVGNGANGFDIDTDNGNPNEILYSNAWSNFLGDYDEQGPGTGSISEDPKIVSGMLGDYYLGFASPSIDSGLGTSFELGLYNGFTTRTDGVWDKGTVDMGFHYASNRGPPAVLPIEKILKIVKENQED
jgi:hypothetical protein